MTTRRRRWSFSLRTLFVVLTLLGMGLAWIAWEVSFIRHRRAKRQWLESGAGWALTTEEYRSIPSGPPIDPSGPTMEIPVWRRWLGDEAMAQIGFESHVPQSDRESLRRLFPEAYISDQ